MEAYDGLIREAGLVCAALCLPVLVAATLVGTVVAILQAATQIQEQTLTLLPKIVAVAAVVAVGGAFGMRLCAGLFNDAIARIPAILSGG
jgi:flagellar biosynthetic protein FliQ